MTRGQYKSINRRYCTAVHRY